MDLGISILSRTLAAMPPLSISVVTETYPPEVNGVAMTLGRFVDGLLQRGHHIQLVRPRQSAEDEAARGERYGEVLVRGLPIPRYDFLKLGLPAGGTLFRMWSARRPDVVHVVTEGPLGRSALNVARQLGIPVVADFHTIFHSYGRHYGFPWLTQII